MKKEEGKGRKKRRKRAIERKLREREYPAWNIFCSRSGNWRASRDIFIPEAAKGAEGNCFHRSSYRLCYRVTVLAVLLGILEWDRSVTCILLLWEYMVGYLAIFAVSIAVEFSICFLATRGSILDTAVRAPMQYVLYVRLREWHVSATFTLIHYGTSISSRVLFKAERCFKIETSCWKYARHSNYSHSLLDISWNFYKRLWWRGNELIIILRRWRLRK